MVPRQNALMPRQKTVQQLPPSLMIAQGKHETRESLPPQVVGVGHSGLYWGFRFDLTNIDVTL